MWKKLVFSASVVQVLVRRNTFLYFEIDQIKQALQVLWNACIISGCFQATRLFIAVKKQNYVWTFIASLHIQPPRSFDGEEEHWEARDKQWLPHTLRDSEGHRAGPVPGPIGGSDATKKPTTDDAKNCRQAASAAQWLERRGER